MYKNKLIIGSRGSELAVWQAQYVAKRIKELHPELTISIEIISTTGDQIADTSLSIIGGKGAFTKEIEMALLERRTDIAVHSLKDLPTVLPDGLTLAAIPERASTADAFLSNNPDARLLHLPNGAIIATGSLRRKAQLLSRRPDFQIVDLRGNVPTRIRKLRESRWDGMILASAGLHRLGLAEQVTHEISIEWLLPAVGQGALGIECRTEDAKVRAILAPLNHQPTRDAVTSERALLAALGGGCQVPIGAFAHTTTETLTLTACIVALDGTSIVRAEHSGNAGVAERIGTELAQTLLSSGGREILNSFSPETDELTPAQIGTNNSSNA